MNVDAGQLERIGEGDGLVTDDSGAAGGISTRENVARDLSLLDSTLKRRWSLQEFVSLAKM
jgi:hypothetical protein